MSDDQKHTKPDGSAWKAHIDAVNERNAQTRKVGLAERQEDDKDKAAARRASELRQMVALKKTAGPSAKAHRR
jgi:hypothetical protein